MSKYDKIFALDGRVAIVAGGGGAIGSEIARGLAEYGCNIGIADLRAEEAEKVASEIAQLGVKTTAIAVDVTDADSVAAAVQHVSDTLGPVDILINTAGTHIEQKAEDVTVKAWDIVNSVNLKGAFLLSQAVARNMIANENGGSIVHITSVRSGLGIHRGYAAYVASKGGLGLLIKQLATEWAKHNIRVNGIAPTFTRTPLVADYLNDKDFVTELVNRIPMGRVCETSDLAGIALFLGSDASSFITGQNIFVDGGVTATQ